MKLPPSGRSEPTLILRPRDAAHHAAADEAEDLYREYWRRPLMPSQVESLRIGMSETKSGHWAAPTFGRMVSRQNAKTDEIELRELYGLLRGEAIVHTAHEFPASKQSFTRLHGVIEGSDDLRRRVRKVYTGGGQTSIEFRNGGIIVYRARAGGKGGRGLDDISTVVYDEAQHLEAEHVAASSPTLAVNPNPQTWIAGTSALSGRSQMWWEIRLRALRGEDEGFGYVEHSAERVSLIGEQLVSVPPTAGDVEAWAMSNPGLGLTIQHSFLASQLKLMGPELFAREHLGVWDPLDSMGSSVIPADVWAGLCDPDSVIMSHDMCALAVSPDRKMATLGIAGRSQSGRLHIESLHRQPGTAWVVAKALEVWKAKRVPIRVHKTGPEGAFIAPLREVGVDVVEVSSAEAAQATGFLIDAANAGVLVHIGQATLDKAVAGAVQRESTDGAVLWSQRLSSVEITPLVAVTVALGGVPQTAASGLFVAFT